MLLKPCSNDAFVRARPWPARVSNVLSQSESLDVSTLQKHPMLAGAEEETTLPATLGSTCQGWGDGDEHG